MPDNIVVPEQPGYDLTFKSRIGPVGRDIERRSLIVEVAAVRQARSRSGILRHGIHSAWIPSPEGNAARAIGSEVSHALVHHEGSRPHVIKPRNAKILRWVNKQGHVVFANSVRHPGTKANRYLLDSLALGMK